MTDLNCKALHSRLARVIAFNIASLVACLVLVLVVSVGSSSALQVLWNNHRAASVGFAMAAILIVPSLVAVAASRWGMGFAPRGVT